MNTGCLAAGGIEQTANFERERGDCTPSSVELGHRYDDDRQSFGAFSPHTHILYIYIGMPIQHTYKVGYSSRCSSAVHDARLEHR